MSCLKKESITLIFSYRRLNKQQMQRYAPVLKIISNKNVLIIVFFVYCSLQEETAVDEIKTEN